MRFWFNYVYSHVMTIACNTTLHTGYAIQEVAHDNNQANQAVSKAIVARGLINSYDTWHGMWFICNPLLLPYRLSIVYASFTRDKGSGQSHEDRGNRASQGQGEDMVRGAE